MRAHLWVEVRSIPKNGFRNRNPTVRCESASGPRVPISDANTVVPEPSTWLLMLNGLGGIGVTVSRCRGGARPA